MSTQPAIEFQPATKEQAKARCALYGPSGAGKTYTSLAIAKGLAGGDMTRVFVVDSEHDSARKFADLFPGFNVINMPDYSIDTMLACWKAAIDADALAIVQDGFSQSWDWLLNRVDEWKIANRGQDQRGAWRDVGTPLYSKMVSGIVRCPVHLVGTMRVKTEWVITEKGKPQAVGLAPKQREGTEYEFDINLRIDRDHNLVVDKFRGNPTMDGQVYRLPGEELGAKILAWLNEGAPAPTGEEGPADISSSPEAPQGADDGTDSAPSGGGDDSGDPGTSSSSDAGNAESVPTITTGQVTRLWTHATKLFGDKKSDQQIPVREACKRVLGWDYGDGEEHSTKEIPKDQYEAVYDELGKIKAEQEAA